MTLKRHLLPFLLLLFVAESKVTAQEAVSEAQSNTLRVFLDCNGPNCDANYFRTEVPFVNWVRDRTLSQIHLFITSTPTGAGGRAFTLAFIGLDNFEGRGDELGFTSNSSDTEDEILSGLSHTIAVGLARYSTLAGQQRAFDIISRATSSAPTDLLVSGEEVEDPWNFWVFEIGTVFDISGEETQSNERYTLNFDATRTTPIWKFEFDSMFDHRTNERERSNGDIVIDERENWNTNLLLAYTLADHWSVGAIGALGSSSSNNEDLAGDAFAAVEFSLYPYEEAPRRSLTARYDLGMRYFDWQEETIFGQTKESHLQHKFRVRYYQRQPWGTATISFFANQYLHDTSLWNASISANVNYRITRGLSIDVRSRYALIEDQLFVSAAGLSEEDILLGRFSRPTDFEYSLRVGLTYEFGSIFNNVINNRF